jgi:YD repeat-containing protein
MKIHRLQRLNRFVIIGLLTAFVATVAEASFTPPSPVTFNAAAYASRASRANATGISSLAAYVSPAACPVKANLFSQDVEYSVPLLSLAGRAGLSLNLTLNYNSKVWIKSASTIYFDGEQSWPAPGWRLGFGRIDGVFSGPDSYNHYYYVAPDGGVHDLRYNGSDSLYESIDSTFMDFNDSTGVLRMKDGTQITFALQGGSGGYVLPTQVKDRNGNYITVNYSGTGQQISSIVDTVGRTVSFSYNTDGTLASISKSGFGGASRSWTFGYTSLTLSYSFASSLTVTAPTSVKVLSSITFPNSTTQTYSYNGYGQLTEVDVKSTSSTVRGKILAAWDSAPGGGWTTSPTPASIGNNDGTTTNTWSLSFGAYTTTVTDPNSTATTTTFVNDSGNWDDGLPSQQQIGSTALKTTANTWGDDSSSLNPRLTQVLITLNDTNQESEIQTDYTTYNNPSEIREYNYGSGGPGTLIRSTDYTYVNSSNYTSTHILNLRATAIVYNGSSSSGTPASNVSYGYDGYSLTSATGASNHDDTNYGTGFAYRGLVTSISQYADPVTPANLVTHTEHYDMLGNLLNASADCCVHQQINFSSTTQYSQPDSVVSGYSGTTTTTSATYDAYTGLVATSTDPNSQTTSYSYDVMDRLSSTTRPDSTMISTSYDDSSSNPGTTMTTPITSTTSAKNTTTFDGLGRPIRATMLDASNTVYSKVDTQYDGLGQTTQTSLPYTGSSASYWTQNSYSATGQLTQMIPADGSSSSNNVAFSFSGNSYTSTDPTGKQSKTLTDPIGRTIETDMPDPSSGNSLTNSTSTTYDALNNVTQTSQGSQTRSFVFDGFGRMTSSTTPEAGAVSFQYSPYGKVTQRTDARGVVTSYSYDNLNRLTQISYDVSGATGVPATPTVSYTYGTSSSSYNNGRLIQMSDGLGTESYTYDQLGRVTQVQKVVDNVKYTTNYSYNLASQIVTMTYPSGRVVKNYYDGIGRTTGVQNNSNSAYYASGIGYDTANDVTGFTYGNGVVASYGYTSQRLLLSSISYMEGSTTLLGLAYGYTQSGGNDAEITSITDSSPSASGRSASYTYNADGALTAASTTGSGGYPAWGLSWTYDRYGNRTAQVVTAGSAYSSSPIVSTSTNHITSVGGHSYTYDASGNLTQDDLFKYKLDGENRMVEVDYISGTLLATYAYDGNSNRTVKVVDGGRTFYLYGAGSKVISVFDDAASNTYTSGTTPGSAVDDYYATLLYQHKDQLTTRLTTDNSGVLASYQGHFPFGEGWYEGGTADPSLQQRFATFMKDYETDSAQLHYAMSEFYSARNGQLQTLVPGRPGVTATSNPYSNIDPVDTSLNNSGNPPTNLPQFAVMTDGGGPLGNGCTISIGCGPGFGNVSLGNSDQFAAYTNGLQGLLTMITPSNMPVDKNGNIVDPTPKQFTDMANTIMAFEDPGSFLNNINYLPQLPASVSENDVSAEQIKKDLIKYINDLEAWAAALQAWEDGVFQKSPQGPLNPASPTSSTATCNLQTQAGTNCSYRCAGNRLFGSFASTVAAIDSTCQLSNTGQCPAQIVIKGLDVSTAKVAACTIF